MIPKIRSLFATGALLGACVIATPASATAQGNSHKAQKVERKIDRKMDRKVDRHVDRQVVRHERRRAVRNAYRTSGAKALCEDGTWAYASVGCGGHGGLAARQYRPIPRASRQAILHANAHSAVARAAYANGIAAGAVALCNDGTYWHATTRTNACYRHGGVNRWR